MEHKKSSSSCNHKNHNQRTNTSSQKSKQSSSWGRDSGARDLDLSPEPNYDKHPSNNDILIHALNNDMMELRARLQKSDIEKEELKMQLREFFEDKDNTQRHLEAISQQHESRITEMHCVIVELNKKLKQQHDTAIIEETEPEGSVSELSFQEGSVYNSEMETANYDQEESDVDQKQKTPQIVDYEQEIQSQKYYQQPQSHVNKQSSPSLPTPNYSSQIQGLQEEILHLRAQIALLQSELACRDHSHEKISGDYHDDGFVQNCDNCKNEENENDKSNYTSDDLCETADIFDIVQQQPPHQQPPTHDQLNEFSRLTIAQCRKTSNLIVASPKSAQMRSTSSFKQPTTNTFEMPVTKIAERVRLKRTMEDDQHITGNELSKSEMFTTEIAEHLVSEFMQMPERDANTSPIGYNNELQRLQHRSEHLKLQNTVLSLTLVESKQHCNHLYLLCGKYESNAVALQQALNCNDRAIEAYDVMLALLESKLGMLESVDAADDNRRAAESVAHLLLDRLKNENSFHGKSMAPWQDAVVILSDIENGPWTDDHDKMLRNQVSKLKSQRSFIQNTVVNLESPFIYDEMNSRLEGSPTKSRNSRSRQKTMDLETAVLMQELMSLREDVGDLKYKAERSDKEKLVAYEKLKSLQCALVQLQSQLTESENKVNPKDRFSYSEAEYNASIERELVEALGRECRLKARLQGLAGSLEIATRGTTTHSSTKQNLVSEQLNCKPH